MIKEKKYKIFKVLRKYSDGQKETYYELRTNSGFPLGWVALKRYGDVAEAKKRLHELTIPYEEVEEEVK